MSGIGIGIGRKGLPARRSFFEGGFGGGEVVENVLFVDDAQTEFLLVSSGGGPLDTTDVAALPIANVFDPDYDTLVVVQGDVLKLINR